MERTEHVISKRTAELLLKKRLEKETWRRNHKLLPAHSPSSSTLCSTSEPTFRTEKQKVDDETDSLLTDKNRLCDLDRHLIDLQDKTDDQIKSIIKEMNRRYRTSMVSSATSDNEKHQLNYYTDNLKDEMKEAKRDQASLEQEVRKWNREIDEQQRLQLLLDLDIERYKDMLQDRDEIIKKNKLVILTSDETTDEVDNSQPLISIELLEKLNIHSLGQLDSTLMNLIQENKQLTSEVNSTRDQLESVRSVNFTRTRDAYKPVKKSASPALNFEQIKLNIAENLVRAKSDQDLKLQRCDIRISSLVSQLNRLEKQMHSHKKSHDNSELVNDKLKSELQTMNNQLQSLKENKSTLSTQIEALEENLDIARKQRLEMLKK